MTLLLHLIGYWIIFAMVDYKRGEESKIKPFSHDQIIVFLMVALAVALIKI